MEHLVKELEKLIYEKNNKVIKKEQSNIIMKYNDRINQRSYFSC